MSGRYEHLDSDEYRLPDGMQRIGYDADTQVYTFRDGGDGTLWESKPGNRFGRLHPAGTRVQSSDGENAMIARARREDWRYMAPFFLLIALFLLMVWHFFGPSWSSSAFTCEGNLQPYYVQEGDSCWAIAKQVGLTVKELEWINDGLDCEGLRPGMGVCLPE